jgi:LmbE family N-acetylglucosaminyl deacetylase
MPSPAHVRTGGDRRSRRAGRALAIAVVILALVPGVGRAQPRGAVALHELVEGLTVTPRVLVVGAHPDDDDPMLIAWLARGRHVETGYLSLTRGEGGESFVGGGSGVSLGAVRTGELLAARRIDGGRSFFTRAYDFGFARTAEGAFEHWERDALLDDIVRIVRSFRPHVLVGTWASDSSDGDGQHDALRLLVREAFDAAGDSTRCPAARCGPPWTPSALYREGDGIAIDAGAYDAVLGRRYVDLALEARSQHRSEGLSTLFEYQQAYESIVRLHRIAARENAPATRNAGSIFDGVDTAFARLGVGASSEVASALAELVAVADSTRRMIDIARPSGSVERLARVARLADAVRDRATWCRHPSADAVVPAATLTPVAAEGGGAPTSGAREVCDERALDLDASIDLVRRRAHDALLAAAGITVEATTGRELVAESDTAAVIVTVANHGAEPVTLHDVRVTGAPKGRDLPRTIPADSAVRLERIAAGLGPARPWWIWSRKNDAYPPVRSALDGVEHPFEAPPIVSVPGVVLPEEIRRTSDVSVTLAVAGATITTSVGPVIHHTASPALGAQDRAVGGAPAVTLAFERALEWIPAARPVDRRIRLSLRSYSDAPQTLALHVALAPTGVHVDSLPGSIVLAPREQRDVFVHVRGTFAADRHTLAVVAQSSAGRKYFEGFQTRELPHVAPTRLYRTSGLYLQAVKVAVPRGLVVAYVQGVGDGGESALAQIGVPSRVLTADELPQLDLSRFTTVVIGPRAFEAHPELVGQRERLLDFARGGGTLVVLNAQHAPRAPGLFAYPTALASPRPEHVATADAPVTPLTSGSRLLAWPNRIDDADWRDWVRDRALFVPSVVDERYARVVEMHDPGQRENRNAILVARLGRGTYVYSAVTFFEQIPAGVTGGLRLFVNLLSAGCRAAEGAGSCPLSAVSGPSTRALGDSARR